MAAEENKGKSGRGRRQAGGRFPGDRTCAVPDCAESGDYRAPVTRPGEDPVTDGPRWQYLCLDHVRAFNAGWNWFEGMSEDEIFEAQSPYAQSGIRRRPFAGNGRHASASAEGWTDLADHLHRFYRGADSAAKTAGPVLPPEERQALSRLGLAADATPDDVRRAFRRLARRYHPDLNDGDRRHEGRLQALREAYDRLMKSARFRAFAGHPHRSGGRAN